MSYLGNQPVNGAFQKLDSIAGSFNGVTATFSTTVSSAAVQAGNPVNLLIVLNGVLQEPSVDYTVTGTTITFTTAPPTGTTFFGMRLGNVGSITGVTDGTISAASLDAGLTATLAAKADTSAVSSTYAVKMTTTVVSGTTQTAVANGHYILTNVAATTLTLPATPSADTIVWVTSTNGLKTNVIARNGSTIMGLAEDFTNDIGNMTFQFKYVNGSWRMM